MILLENKLFKTSKKWASTAPPLVLWVNFRVMSLIELTFFDFTDCAVNFIVTPCDAGEYTCEVMVTSDSFFSQRDHLRISPSMFLKNIDRILLFCSRACTHTHLYLDMLCMSFSKTKKLECGPAVNVVVLHIPYTQIPSMHVNFLSSLALVHWNAHRLPNARYLTRLSPLPQL